MTGAPVNLQWKLDCQNSQFAATGGWLLTDNTTALSWASTLLTWYDVRLKEFNQHPGSVQSAVGRIPWHEVRFFLADRRWTTNQVSVKGTQTTGVRCKPYGGGPLLSRELEAKSSASLRPGNASGLVCMWNMRTRCIGLTVGWILPQVAEDFFYQPNAAC